MPCTVGVLAGDVRQSANPQVLVGVVLYCDGRVRVCSCGFGRERRVCVQLRILTLFDMF